MKKIILVMYIPVLHEGYLKLFERYAHRAECLYVLGEDFIAEDPYIAREIRAMKPEISARIVQALNLFPIVEVLDKQKLFHLKRIQDRVIVLSGDEMSRAFAEKYLHRQQVIFETQFLRWDQKSVHSAKQISFDRESRGSFDRKMMRLSQQEGEKTSCWWRRVGSVLVRDSEIVMRVHNHHVPSDHTPYAVGDPRDVLVPGVSPEIASSMHAEQTAIAKAAREGISLRGTHLYLPVFPCTVCAKLIAYSGISKVFFYTGHASLDGDTVLRSQGVELVHVT